MPLHRALPLALKAFGETTTCRSAGYERRFRYRRNLLRYACYSLRMTGGRCMNA